MRIPSSLRWPTCLILIAAVSVVAVLVGPASSGATESDAPSSDLLLILDASGSMWGQIDGENKIVIARRVVADLIDSLPQEQQLGLVAYGHRREGDCDDIELVTPLGALDRDTLKQTVDGLNPKGKTPITRSVEKAFEVIGQSNRSTTVVLVSDGLETCGGDPCATVRAAKERGLEFVLHVIGFDVGKENVAQLECTAQAGNGLYLSAENAQELGAALESAVALTAEVPAGGLMVKATSDGELQDVAVHVRVRGTGEDAGGGRTYATPETNPRRIPLAAGSYDVEVRAVGLEGDIERRFEITIPDEGTVEKELDFSAGEISVGVTRGGALSDATIRIFVAGTRQQAAAGRTYNHAKSNPRSFRLTAGTYDLVVKALEFANETEERIEGVVIEPQGTTQRNLDFESGGLTVGAIRGGELVDAALRVKNAAGVTVAQKRTYTASTSNPRTFILAPGQYEVQVQELGGATETLAVTIENGATIEKMVELPSP